MVKILTIQIDQSHQIKEPIVLRKASRAIIQTKEGLIMICSKKYGEYKFPGGGVKDGEDLLHALTREVAEETGYHELHDIQEFGLVSEYKKATDFAYTIFQNDSYYFTCQVKGTPRNTKLDPYEQDYGYHVVVVSIEAAIKNNRLLFGNQRIPWVERDTAVLELLLGKT